MIAKLKGILDSTGEDWAVIDVGGVGYLIFASSRTLARLGNVGGVVSVLVETHVREDHIHLYGFADSVERAWFRLLTTVQGVGAKMALSLQSALSSEDLSLAIAAGDKAMLTRASGVGPKLAQRITIELKDKASGLGLEIAANSKEGETDSSSFSIDSAGGALGDALSALTNLGYRRAEAHQALLAARRLLGEDADMPTLLRSALKELGREKNR